VKLKTEEVLKPVRKKCWDEFYGKDKIKIPFIFKH